MPMLNYCNNCNLSLSSSSENNYYHNWNLNKMILSILLTQKMWKQLSDLIFRIVYAKIIVHLNLDKKAKRSEAKILKWNLIPTRNFRVLFFRIFIFYKFLSAKNLFLRTDYDSFTTPYYLRLSLHYFVFN